MNLFCFFTSLHPPQEGFYKGFSQICNKRLHPPQEGSSPLEVGGAALLRLYPSYGGWGPNSIESLTNPCIYKSDNKQHYYLSILMHNNGSMQA